MAQSNPLYLERWGVAEARYSTGPPSQPLISAYQQDAVRGTHFFSGWSVPSVNTRVAEANK